MYFAIYLALPPTDELISIRLYQILDPAAPEVVKNSVTLISY